MNLSSATNALKPVQDELSQYRGKQIFFDTLKGNHGDKLIQMGSLRLFHSLGIKLVNNPKKAEAIIVNGGGGMNDIWGLGFYAIKTYSALFPDKPLIILPSSFDFDTTYFPALFGDRTAPAYLYSRERYSLKMLESFHYPCEVKLGIDHDMAFCLSQSSYVEKLRSSQARNHILIVERGDPEGVTRTELAIEKKPNKPLVSRIPRSVKKPVNEYIRWPLRYRNLSSNVLAGVQSEFARAWIDQVKTDYPDLQSLPIYAADISLPDFFSFNQFGTLIAKASVIVTTRLHVAILASMLDKPTYLKAGSYHKIPGVFDYSLKGKANFRLI